MQRPTTDEGSAHASGLSATTHHGGSASAHRTPLPITFSRSEPMTCLGSVGDMLQQGTAGTTRRIGVPVFLVDRVWAVGLVEFFHTYSS